MSSGNERWKGYSFLGRCARKILWKKLGTVHYQSAPTEKLTLDLWFKQIQRQQNTHKPVGTRMIDCFYPLHLLIKSYPSIFHPVHSTTACKENSHFQMLCFCTCLHLNCKNRSSLLQMQPITRTYVIGSGM